jgi:DNA mismatch repair protein MutS2
LKTLAYTVPGFINGSFEFDESTLSPTYHLRIGVPGSSKAITIAERLGLSKPLVEEANRHLGAEHSDFQDMIEQLETRLAEVDRQRQLVQDTQEQADHLQNELQKTKADLDIEREKLRAGLATRMESELEQANDLVRSMIADLQKAPSIAKAQQVQKDLKVIRQELGWLESGQYEEQQQRFQIGQTVRVRAFNQRVVIEELPEEGKTGSDALATVRSGSIKMKVPLADLQHVQQDTVAPSSSKAARTSGRPGQKLGGPDRSRAGGAAAAGPPPGVDVFVRTGGNTLDLRGQRVDEAMAQLEQFIDSAYLERTSPVMVIHGHGTGRVRAAVREYLSQCSYDAKWRPGENYEGGDGVTVVSFQ